MNNFITNINSNIRGKIQNQGFIIKYETTFRILIEQKEQQTILQ